MRGSSMNNPRRCDPDNAPDEAVKPVEVWLILCACGQPHVDESMEAFGEKEHAEDGLSIVADNYDEECGPHSIAKFRKVD